ncbi:MAG: flagellar biosynthesis protein FlhB [Spirochaetota bacterium]
MEYEQEYRQLMHTGAMNMLDVEPRFRFDIQLLAAEDEGRTEEPSEYKKRKAREEGKVAKTQELPGAMVLLFGFFILFLFSRSIFQSTLAMVQRYLNLVPEISGGEDVKVLFAPIIPVMIRIVGPLFGVVFVTAFLGNLVQVGFKFTAKTIKPDPSKINPNPIRFFTKVLFTKQSAVNLAKSVFKIAAISAVAFFLVKNDIHTIMKTVQMGTLQGFGLGMFLAFKLIMIISGILLLLSIPDYLFQRREHLESLKMTRQEAKEERKMLEGDPLLRSRVREKQREFSKRRMMQEVPNADVVITNPVHYAVALKYEMLKMEAPRCLAKGQDHIAGRIKEIARENEVPVVENKPLARELYRRVDVGEEIPDDLFTAVAEVLAFVYRLKKEEVG